MLLFSKMIAPYVGVCKSNEVFSIDNFLLRGKVQVPHLGIEAPDFCTKGIEPPDFCAKIRCQFYIRHDLAEL